MSGAEFDCQYEASDEASESELLDRSLSVWTGWSTLERKEDYAPIALDLHTASSIGQYDRVRNIIQRADEDLNRKNLGGWTPLMYACYIGHDNIVNLLLDAGVSVNVRNNKGQTPLMLAASCGNESVAYFLLQQGADLEAKDKKSWTALFHATYSGHQNVVKFLLDSGADTEVVEPSREFTPLMEAAAEGHEIIVQCLLQHGVDVNARSCRGDTARSLALYYGHTKIVSLIDNYCLMPRQARKETGIPQRAPADLSSSDEAVQIPRGQSSRGSRSKNKGPRIQDGPQAFDRLMEKQGSPSSVQEERPSVTAAKGAPAEFVPRAYVPSGYYTFPYDGKSQPVQHIRSRDILSPINPEDETLDSSGGREMGEFDDGSPFSKTGALTIKSSSGSSGGLAGALGLNRDSCEDSDNKDTPHLKTIHTGIENLHITESETKDSDHKAENVSAYGRHSKTSDSVGRTKEKRKKSKRHDKSSADHVRSASLTIGATCAVHEHLERFTRDDTTQPEGTKESPGIQYKSLTNERQAHNGERRKASERTVHYNVENRVSHVAKEMLSKETEIRIPERRHSRGMLGKAPHEYDSTWTRPHDLGSLLDAIGMSKYLHIFEEQDVDMQVFLSLTDNDLKEVGIKLFGPRRKMTNAIARWHSNVRPSGNDLEQAYADKLEAEMQEMAIQLHRSCEQTEQLKAQLLQEQELRSVTEGCLMDDRSAWQYVRRLAANTRQLCEEMQHLSQHSSLCQEELSRRLSSGTSTGEHKAPSGDQRENQGGGSFKNSPADLTNMSTSKILSHLQSISDQVQRHLVSSSINMDEMLGQEFDYDRIENYS